MKKNSLDDLRNQISIVDVIGNYIKLSRKGNNNVGICPFHQDHHASLSVNEQKKIFKCFACNEAGDVFSFIKKYEHINYSEAILKACELAHIDQKIISGFKNELKISDELETLYKINQAANKYFQLFLDNKENQAAKSYLYERHFDDALIKKFAIGFSPKDKKIMVDLLNNQNDILNSNQSYGLEEIKAAGLIKVNYDGEFESYFTNRITFPIYDQFQHIVGFSARTYCNEEPKYLNTATTKIFNKSKILYNIQNVICSEPDTIYILEGFMDVIALSKIDINNCLATMGVAFSSEHLAVLKQFNGLKNIILCFDNDSAGKEAIKKTAQLLLNHFNVYVVHYLSSHKDFDELVNSDIELAKKTINNIVQYDSYLIDELINKINSTNNQVQKNSLMQDLIDLLKTIKNDFVLLQSIKKVSETLNLDQDLLLNTINLSNKKSVKKTNRATNKKYELNQEIILLNQPKKATNEIDSIKISETEILKGCLVDRKYEFLCFEKNTKLLNKKIKEIIDAISDFYYENPQAISIINLDEQMINKLKQQYINQEEWLMISTLMKEIKEQNIKFCDDKFNEILVNHKKKVLRNEKQIVYQKYKDNEISEDEFYEILSRINKKI